MANQSNRRDKCHLRCDTEHVDAMALLYTLSLLAPRLLQCFSYRLQLVHTKSLKLDHGTAAKVQRRGRGVVSLICASMAAEGYHPLRSSTSCDTSTAYTTHARTYVRSVHTPWMQ